MKFELKLSKRQEWLRDCVVHHHLTGLDFVKYKVVRKYLECVSPDAKRFKTYMLTSNCWLAECTTVNRTFIHKKLNKYLKYCGVKHSITYQTIAVVCREWERELKLQRKLLMSQPY